MEKNMLNFLNEYKELCIKHNMYISGEDTYDIIRIYEVFGEADLITHFQELEYV